MKIIGLIGGMSWESSAEYYRLINEGISGKLGGLHSAKCILYSVDFEEMERYQAEGNWKQAGKVLATVAKSLEKAGVDFIVLCTNTMHKVMEYIEAEITIPILHIADATANQINARQIKKVGLLGTKYTMEQDFYKSRIESQGIQIIVPDEKEMNDINKIIFEELCLGKIIDTSRDYYKNVINSLIGKGADGIILGCTEIGLLIKQKDAAVPLFDTTAIHATEAVRLALE